MGKTYCSWITTKRKINNKTIYDWRERRHNLSIHSYLISMLNVTIASRVIKLMGPAHTHTGISSIEALLWLRGINTIAEHIRSPNFEIMQKFENYSHAVRHNNVQFSKNVDWQFFHQRTASEIEIARESIRSTFLLFNCRS